MRKDFRPVLELALKEAVEYLNRVDTEPVGATVSLEELRARLCRAWNAEGIDASEVISELARDTAGALNNSMNARFYAWVIGGSLPAALAADWLTSTWDQNAGMYAVSPAAAVVEEAVGGWLRELFGLPPETSFALGDGLSNGARDMPGGGALVVIEETGLGCGTTGNGRLARDYSPVRVEARDYRSYFAAAGVRGRVVENTEYESIGNA